MADKPAEETFQEIGEAIVESETEKPENGSATTAYENLDDARSQSQDSLDLIIDEKPHPKDNDEDMVDDKELANMEATKGGLSRTDSKDENGSCEDISEMSTVTQIDVAELNREVEEQVIDATNASTVEGELNTDVPMAEGNAHQDGNSDTESNNFQKADMSVSIIEIDDEDDEGMNDESNILTTNVPDDDTAEQQKDNAIIERKNEAAPESTAEDYEMLDEAPQREKTPTPQIDSNDLEDAETVVYCNKECINCECPRNHKQYYRAPQFALSFFNVTKKRGKNQQYVCSDCFDAALATYEELCGVLQAKLPLPLHSRICKRQEFVEIIDSSDEEDIDNPAERDDGEQCLNASDLKLIEEDLESVMKEVLERIDISQQMTWGKTILQKRLEKVAEDNATIEMELRALHKRADKMNISLYQNSKMKVRQLQPIDLNTGRTYTASDSATSKQLPPVGELLRAPITLNEVYYAAKNKAIASWVPCKAIDTVESTYSGQKSMRHYKLKFLKSQYSMLKTVSVKHLAYFEAPPVQLPLGTRVIAYFDASKEKMVIQSAFYPGIIAEPLKPNNKNRYLIFYDDGYTQYVHHDDVRLVCHASENVWEDVHPGSRDFIQKYLTQYLINRPMVQTQKGQNMATESNGKWMYARVVDIDCSLIQMQFEGPKTHTEWIYRGSLRLGPVFKEHQKSLQKNAMPPTRLPRRTEPFIRYTEDEETSTNQQRERTVEARAVAKKSVSRQDSSTSSHVQTPAPVVRHLNNSTIYVEDENKPKGKVVFYTPKRDIPPLAYKPHTCSPKCPRNVTSNLSSYSLLTKPLLSGWERIFFRQKIKKVVAYRAPCGKILRNTREMHEYLRCTENSLNVDNFDFSPDINCLAEYVIESAFINKRDVSEGQEKMPIPLVNYYDNTMPPECKYAAQRIPTEGVNLNLDEEFLVGCDCEGDCSDKEKCSCWQLTHAGAKYGNPNTAVDEIGYQYKRLYEHVPTGIYECNSRCKCKSNCLNRVVQQSLQMKLQVFKTSNRGWGLRCINDIPRGSFICIYAGYLLTEANANEGGIDAGDEYFAELDYIEVAEQIKEGYESDVEWPDPDEEDAYTPDCDDDDEFTPSKSYNSRSKKKMNAAEDDSQERQVINFNPNAEMSENSLRESSIRKLFGKDEACYIMDAKVTGNLGRYFNHSCSPNLFVQNVFVDTHDLRFPWVAFFATTNIRAGSELTWNYNYEVGVVPGKVLYCQCGAANCRLRLL